MSTYRVDFEVKADLVLAADSPALTINGGGYSLELRNGKSNQRGDVTGLVASVIGTDESLADAAHNFRIALARRLDWLTVTTQLRFEILKPKIAIEWDAGAPVRQFLAVASLDPRWPPSPELDSELTSSAQRFVEAELPGYLEVAARAFRVGIRELSPEDQFQSFWTALEAVVEGTKDKTKVAVPCQKCGGALTCPVCHVAQVKTPMATKEISKNVVSILGDDKGPRAFRALLYLRNRLTHGGSLLEAERELERKHKITLHQCVEIIARLAHHAILHAAHPHLNSDASITFGAADRFAAWELNSKMIGEIQHDGPGDHPNPPEFNFEAEASLTPFENAVLVRPPVSG